MHRFPGLRRFMHLDRGGRSIERGVADELRFHFEMTMRDLMNDGMSPDDARREAERRFGNVERTRERLEAIDRARVERERRAEWWGAFSQDLRYALRGLRFAPVFAGFVVLTLGLGIGANAAMFGIVDRLLFRPPAFLVAPERTHKVYFARMVDGKEFVGPSSQYQRYLDLAQSSRTIERFAAYSRRRLAVGSGDAARELQIGAASASLWQMFDARPALGRFFTAEEDKDPGAARVVVLSYPYWQSEYAGASDVIGKTMTLGSSIYTIIGVAPRHFSAFELTTPSAFIPITAAAVDGFSTMWTKYRKSYNISWLEVYARRKPGVSADAATADLTQAYRQSWAANFAMSPGIGSLAKVKPRAIAGSVLQQRAPTLSADTKVAAWLLGVASIVLLIACANVGNLLLARAFARRREIAVRIALGVSRARLVSQLLVESMLLAVLGATAGLVIAQWGGRLLRSTLVPDVEWDNTLGDTRVLLFAGACALGAGLLAGLAPIVQAGRSDVAAALKAGAREGYGRRSRVRTALLIVQAAMSVVLLVGAGLFVRSVRTVNTLHLGYDADRLIWLSPRLRGVKLDSAQQQALYDALMDRARANRSVAGVTRVVTVPFSMTFSDDFFASGTDSVRQIKSGIMETGSPGYFATVGTRIIRGRDISAQDREGSARVAVISAEMARAGWPNQDPIGKCLRMSDDTMPCRTVVGVAENIKLGDLGGPPDAIAYLPVAQVNAGFGSLYVRTRGDASSQTDAIRRDLQTVLPSGGYIIATPLSDVLAPATRSYRLGATMFVVFGMLALALAAIGLYSVVAYGVTQRTHEMGVRIALGARVVDVVALIVRDGVRVVIVGVAIGLAVSAAAGHWLAPLLFETSPRDPLVFAGVGVTLLGVALAASWLPARRAAHVDPATALRVD
ncbi:MAG TPA: ABC transporter permease [Gemmatimonadaceae bacterium]|nr:ABC transporter permease [Gemmatimonadaceae bacterium]